jgi:hypothetical protein
MPLAFIKRGPGPGLFEGGLVSPASPRPAPLRLRPAGRWQRQSRKKLLGFDATGPSSAAPGRGGDRPAIPASNLKCRRRRRRGHECDSQCRRYSLPAACLTGRQNGGIVTNRWRRKSRFELRWPATGNLSRKCGADSDASPCGAHPSPDWHPGSNWAHHTSIPSRGSTRESRPRLSTDPSGAHSRPDPGARMGAACAGQILTPRIVFENESPLLAIVRASSRSWRPSTASSMRALPRPLATGLQN